MEDFPKELVLEFIAECSDMIEEIEPQMLSAESLNQQLANSLFRPVHSLKGSSASLGFNHIAHAVHGAENLLSIFQKGQFESSDGKYLAFFLRFFDFIRESFSLLSNEFSDAKAEENSGKIIEEAKALMDEIAAIKEGGGPEQVAPVEAPKPSSAEKSTPKAPVKEELVSDEGRIEIDKEMMDSFAAECRDIFSLLEEKLLFLSKNPKEVSSIEECFRNIHSFKGNCGIFSLKHLEKLSHRTETVLEAVKSKKIDSKPAVYDAILPIVDVLKETVEKLLLGGPGEILGLDLYIDILDGFLAKAEASKAEEKKPEPVKVEEKKPEPVKAEEKKPEPVKVEEKRPEPVKVEEKRPEPVKAGEKKPEPVKASAPKVEESPKVSPARAALKASQTKSEDEGSGDEKGAMKRQDIRVDVTKLDSLNNLVGELVTVKTMVYEHLKKLQERDQTEKTFRLLDRVTTELQDVSMSIRMIPVAGLFKKMIRIVHDISIKSGKKINFKFTGEETEIDKTVIEKISDPLVHMIRNAVDHGVEAPEVRIEKGKPEAGNVTLSAKNEAGEIWIILKDDGNGINKDAVIKKAVSQGLIQGDGSNLTEQQVYGLIFLPGFSTAAKVTDISGRGVGMDVVKTNIEELKGKVEIHSELGKGTTFIIKIPLTLAVIQGMMLEVADSKYTLPIEQVRESVRISKLNITHPMESQELVSIRGEMLPVLRLSDLHEIEGAVKNVEDGILIVVESRNDKIALLVDRLIGQTETVVKPLPKYFQHIKGVSGCSILGNGDASLILDVTTLIDLAKQKTK